MSQKELPKVPINRVTSISFAHPVNVFDSIVTAVNADRIDLSLGLDTDMRCLVIKHKAEKFKGKTMYIPFESVMAFTVTSG